MLAASVGAAGCQRLNHDATLTVEPGDAKTLIIDPPSVNQDVKVEFKSTTEPVSVYLVLEKDVDAALGRVNAGMKPEEGKFLGGQEKAMEGTLEGKVPAKSGYQVIVGGANKKTEVNVKVTGK